MEAELQEIDAVMVAVPADTAVASPYNPAALLMVATPVSDELQVTDEVASDGSPLT